MTDRVSKFWAFSHLTAREKDIFPGLRFELAWNRGISFGSLQFDSPYYFWLLTTGIIFVTLMLCLHMVHAIRKHECILGEVFILAGACSNLIDRFVYGAVLDFIDLYVGPWHWYTFNLADTWIVVGACFMLYKYLMCHEEGL